MSRKLIDVKHTLARLLPGQLVGALEFNAVPNFCGSAFNDQCGRQCLFVQLCKTLTFDVIVETGTFRGATTRFMAATSKLPVYSVEASSRYQRFAARRLRGVKNIHLFLGDSVSFLAALAIEPERAVFFYLDAHWDEHLPLREEVDIILGKFTRSVIMIDDFRVPLDSDYRYDNYGPGTELSLTDFPFDQDPRVRVFFPSTPAAFESGAKRGCVVLATTQVAQELEGIPSLRPFAGSEPRTPTTVRRK